MTSKIKGSLFKRTLAIMVAILMLASVLPVVAMPGTYDDDYMGNAYEIVQYESENDDDLYYFDTELESECGEFVFIFVPSDRDDYEDYLYYSDFDFDGDYIGIEPLQATTQQNVISVPGTTIQTNWSATFTGPVVRDTPDFPATHMALSVASGWRIDRRLMPRGGSGSIQSDFNYTVVRTGGAFTIPTVATHIGNVHVSEAHNINPIFTPRVDVTIRVYIRRASPARTVNFDPAGGTWPAPANSQGVLSRTLASGQDNYTSILNTDNLTLRSGDQNPPQRQGYEFLGWFTTAESGGTRVLRTSAAPLTDHTLFARWAACQDCYPDPCTCCPEGGCDGNYCTVCQVCDDSTCPNHGVCTCNQGTGYYVTFAPGIGGSGTPPPVQGQYAYQTIVAAPASSALTRPGFVQVGWRLDHPTSGSFVAMGGTLVLRGNHTLYAEWMLAN